MYVIVGLRVFIKDPLIPHNVHYCRCGRDKFTFTSVYFDEQAGPVQTEEHLN